MKQFDFKFGRGTIPFSVPGKNILSVVKPNKMEKIEKPGMEVVRDALNNPIKSKKLSELVKEGDTVCVVVPDVTRAWQSPSLYVPPVIDELNKGGVRDKDIVILSATGSHRKQSEDEHKILVSEDVQKRIKVIDHNSKDEDNLVNLGTTSFGTPLFISKIALECDHIVLTGGAILHFLAGYGGGRKYILPGIAGYKTIMHNHSYSMNEGLNSGTNPETRSGNMVEENIIHMDMMEAAEIVKPLFIMNVVVDSNKQITHAFAGDYIKAHEAACEIVKEMDTVTIDQKADMVIASASGYPKDINFYQMTKTVLNAVEAVKDNGTLIVASENIEGFGSSDTEYIISCFSDMLSREMDIREKYTIGKYLGYKPLEIAEKVNFILVTSMKEELFESTKISVVSSIDEAIDLGKKKMGIDEPSMIIMPYGANTLPIVKE